MWQRRVRTAPRRASGTASIRRESYSTVNGMNTKTGWYEIQNKVAKRSGGRCEARINGERCGGKACDCHHIIPLSRGGTTTMGNVIHLCLGCHTRRHHHMQRNKK